MKLAIFGTFFPLTARLASATTGMVYLLSKNEKVGKIRLYAQKGAELPASFSSDKCTLIECWSVDKPFSIANSIVRLSRDKEADAYFFDLSLTMFGIKKVSNFIGLLMPPLLAKITKKKVLVYMHDFIETEEIEKLGYTPTFFSRLAASFLEKLIVKNTILIVPRPSQQIILESKYGTRIHSLIIPYVEGIYLERQQVASNLSATLNQGKRVNILLFGRWGPQKDLPGGLRFLSRLINAGCDINVIVAGGVNVNFPDYFNQIKYSLESFPQKNLIYLPKVSDEEVSQIFQNADILFLPYRTSGGYSAVMNLAALYGLRIIAYDISQLREVSSLIGVDAIFIEPENSDSVEAVKKVITEMKSHTARALSGRTEKLLRASQYMNQLVQLLTDET
jgi:glycosyltransferase involved in cell wall biosynthesis